MSLEQKLILAAVVRGLPYMAVVVCGIIAVAKRRSIAAGVLAVGFAAVGAKDVWSLFAPVWVRTYSAVQYSTINLRFSVAHDIGLYLISIALAVILLMKKGKSDNNVLENTGTNAPDSQH